MGLKGAKGEEGMKVKKGRRQEKSAPANRAACRFMWCCIIIHQPQEMGKLKQCDAYGFVCVCVYLLLYCTTLLFSILMLFLSPPKQTDF